MAESPQVSEMQARLQVGVEAKGKQEGRLGISLRNKPPELPPANFCPAGQGSSRSLAHNCRFIVGKSL